MTTTTDFDQILSVVEQAETAKSKTEAEAAEALARADAISQDAEAARLAAEAESRQASAATSSAFVTIMRKLTDEVRDARAAAAAAVTDGTEPAFEAWLRYRRLRAHNRGTWRALTFQYDAVMARPAPPGEWGPELFVADGTYGPVWVETFDQFVTTVLHEWETAEVHRVSAAQWEELTARKAAAQ